MHHSASASASELVLCLRGMVTGVAGRVHGLCGKRSGWEVWRTPPEKEVDFSEDLGSERHHLSNLGHKLSSPAVTPMRI